LKQCTGDTHTGRACADHIPRVLLCDSSLRKDGNAVDAGVRQRFEAEARSRRCLRKRREDRRELCVVGSGIRGVADLGRAVCRNANECVGPKGCARIADGDCVEAEVHAIGVERECNVDSFVDEDARAASGRLRSVACGVSELACEVEEFAALEFAFPNLEPIRARGENASDRLRERMSGSRSVHDERERGAGVQRIARPSSGLEAEA
jgi:hypothetical protein